MLKTHYDEEFDEIEERLSFAKRELSNDSDRIDRLRQSICRSFICGVDNTKLIDYEKEIEEIEFGLRVAMQFVSVSRHIIKELIQAQKDGKCRHDC